MAQNAKSKNSQPLTTAQRLSSIVKACRDIMRKDKGLNGDLDRLPMLTWVMFLKFLDDHEQLREERSRLNREKYRPLIERPRKASAATPSSTSSPRTRASAPTARAAPDCWPT